MLLCFVLACVSPCLIAQVFVNWLDRLLACFLLCVCGEVVLLDPCATLVFVRIDLAKKNDIYSYVFRFHLMSFTFLQNCLLIFLCFPVACGGVLLSSRSPCGWCGVHASLLLGSAAFPPSSGSWCLPTPFFGVYLEWVIELDHTIQVTEIRSTSRKEDGESTTARWSKGEREQHQLNGGGGKATPTIQQKGRKAAPLKTRRARQHNPKEDEESSKS